MLLTARAAMRGSQHRPGGGSRATHALNEPGGSTSSGAATPQQQQLPLMAVRLGARSATHLVYRHWILGQGDEDTKQGLEGALRVAELSLARHSRCAPARARALGGGG